jgi:phosphosulfolactate phosphohydrolase-like enzyme
MLVERFVKLSPRLVAPEQADGDPHVLALDDSAIVAHRLFRSYLAPNSNGHAGTETLMGVFAEARNGRRLPLDGFGADLEYCSEIDVTTAVPHLEVRDGVLAVVVQAPGDSRQPD